MDTEGTYACSIWGPTCDSMDCINKHCELPEMVIGDWMYFENMGAYTSAASSQFNGFKNSTIIYVQNGQIYDKAQKNLKLDSAYQD